MISKVHNDTAGYFVCFHDGTIDSASWNARNLTLRIEISYLTERMSPSPEAFLIQLADAELFGFSPWLNACVPESAVIAPRLVLDDECEILSAEAEEQCVAIVLNQPDTSKQYTGGILRISASNIACTDDSGRSYPLETVLELADGYWNEWKSRHANAAERDTPGQ